MLHRELLDTQASFYWSSTTRSYFTYHAWFVHFEAGGDGMTDKSTYFYVRAVRGGQAGSLDHLVISAPKQASAWHTGAVMPVRWNTVGLGTNVKISLSRQGGLSGTFETIIETTSNDGQYDWTITGAESVNCVIKIEQLDSPYNWATEGLFVIKKGPAKSAVNPGIFLLLLE
jgi:hypothetical protein